MFEAYDDILYLYEVSEILKVGTTQIYKLLRSGALKGYKEGKTGRYLRLHWNIISVRKSIYSDHKMTPSVYFTGSIFLKL